MKNLIDYFRDKIYYILGGTIFIIILLVIISSCSSSSSSSYQVIEDRMVNAAKKYYSKYESKLPQTEDGVVKVTISTLIDDELIKEVKDPKDKSQDCTGYVEVTKVGSKEYSYIPFLTCKGNYEPKYLTDKLKATKTDEYGNGLYQSGSEYLFKGDTVKNYVSFNNQLWRILKIDSVGDIKLILSVSLEKSYKYDDKYNSEVNRNYGVTTDYLQTNIRKVLNEYYKTNFSSDSKAKIVSKTLCVGSYSQDDIFSSEKECAVTKDNEKIGLINITDYQNATLSTSCNKISDGECSNFNFLNNYDISTWTINSDAASTYEVFYYNSGIYSSRASDKYTVNPVIYLSGKVLTLEGKGTEKNPYIIK